MRLRYPYDNILSSEGDESLYRQREWGEDIAVGGGEGDTLVGRNDDDRCWSTRKTKLDVVSCEHRSSIVVGVLGTIEYNTTWRSLTKVDRRPRTCTYKPPLPPKQQNFYYTTLGVPRWFRDHRSRPDVRIYIQL
jgi:hypothetical protein